MGRIARGSIWAAWLIVLSLSLAGVSSAQADSPAVKYHFNIPAEDAASALAALAEQSNAQVGFAPDQVAGWTTRALVGQYTLREALGRLLDGTKLSYQFHGPNAVSVSGRPLGASDRGTAPSSAAPGSTPTSKQDSDLRSGFQADVLQEVVVTAQKRAEKTQSVPISITALTSSKLDETGIEDSQSLQQVVPSLIFQRVANAGQPFVRGLGSYNPTVGDESATAVYVDGVYMAAMDQSLFSLNNIERIEVLKGPQGTLFGRNAAAGVINIITRDPQSEPHADAEVSYGSYQRRRGSFYGTAGVIGNVAADLAILVDDQNQGWGRDVVTGKRAFWSNDYAVRNKWKLGLANTNITLSLDWNRLRADYGSQTVPVPGWSSADGSVFVGRYDVWSESSLDNSFNEQYGSALKIDHDFSWTKLVSISSWRGLRARNPVDQDGGPLVLGSAAPVNIRESAYTQEFQLLSQPNSPLTWVAGLYYFHQKAGYYPLHFDIEDVAFPFPPAPPFTIIPIPRTTIDIYSQQTTASYSGFGQATYEILPKLNLTAGARYTLDTRRLDGLIVGLPLNHDRQNFGKLTFKVGLDYHVTDDVMTYAQFSRGFKSGVYNIVNPYAPAVRPETIDAVEVGAKSEFLNHRLRVNAAAFHYDASQLQVNSVILGTEQLFNAASATVKGAELEVDAIPIEHLNLSVSAAYLDATFDHFPNAAPIYTPNPAPNPLGGPSGFISGFGDASGNTMPNAPKWALNFATTYNLATNVGTFSISTNVSYTGRNYSVDNQFFAPAYALATLTGKWLSPDGRWDVRATLRNLLGRDYVISRLPGYAPMSLFQVPGEPRTWELTVGHHF